MEVFIQLFQFTLSDQSFKGTGQDRKQLQPHPLETPTFLSSKWLAIGDLRCMDEALLILLIIIH